jgi:hypothetical protein
MPIRASSALNPRSVSTLSASFFERFLFMRVSFRPWGLVTNLPLTDVQRTYEL